MILCEKNSENLAICYINDTVGYGVFALKDFEIGEFNSIYAGPYHQLNSKLYGKEYEKNGYLMYIASDNKGNNLISDTSKKGNITRFIQHAYTAGSEALSYFKFESKESVTANCEAIPFFIKQNKIYVIRNIEKIKKNQILTLDYDPRYWKIKGIMPYFFNQKGDILSHTEYDIVKYEIRLYPQSELFENGSTSMTFTKKALIDEFIKPNHYLTFSAEKNFLIKATAQELKKAMDENKNTMILKITTTNFFNLNYEKFIKKTAYLLEKITHLNWEFNPKIKKALIEYNDDLANIYQYLKEYKVMEEDKVYTLSNKIKLQRFGILPQSKWSGKRVISIDLSLAHDLQILAKIPPLQPSSNSNKISPSE